MASSRPVTRSVPKVQRWVMNAWPALRRILVAAIVSVVAFLLFNVARTIDWAKVLEAARNIGNPTVATAAGLVCVGYTAYASFDLLARHYVRHNVPAGKVLGLAAISYGLNQSLGVLLGGIGARLRLYLKLGVRRSAAVRVVLFSIVTNWLGYCWLGGSLFVSRMMPIPQGWEIGAHFLQAMGAGMLIIAAGYLVLCAASNRRIWSIRQHRVELPSLKIALLQSGLAMLSWMSMALIIYVLLEQRAPYLEVLSILLFCSIAAVITHIPGGLGVTEAIFVAVLSPRLPSDEILAAILMYRVLYATGPLCLALVSYLTIEARFRRHAAV